MGHDYPGALLHFAPSGESSPIPRIVETGSPPKAQSPNRSNAQAKGLASASSEAFLAGERPAPSGSTEGASVAHQKKRGANLSGKADREGNGGTMIRSIRPE